LNNGVEHLKKARALFLDLTREQPANEDFQHDLANTSHILANALERAGDPSGALEQYRAAASTSEKLVEKKPHDKMFRLSQLKDERSLALALWKQQGDETTARAVIDKALGLIQALIAEDPTNASYQNGLFHLNLDAGQLRAETDPAVALGYFRKAAEVEEKLLTADAANSEAEIGLADIYMNIAHALSRQGDASQALSYYSKSAEHYEKYTGLSTHPHWGVSLKAVTARAGAAAMRAQLGGYDVALEECSRLTERLREIPDDPASTENRLFRAETYEYLGYAYRDIAAASKGSINRNKQYFTAARDMFRQSMNIVEDVRSRGGLDMSDKKQAKSVAAELAKCDAALGK
jgi:tetratricopeptide (TPR) repeat protein